ncbi:swr complex subunit [Rhizopus azygosporus]|uniref:SWR1-complex protein 4 n=1 Tax=Rhizopus azygosporus TaxID=86630 RepID=A0A367J1G6_RHIAZ|nr:swr complex subunit [Rhizopus azygosporus]
MSSSDIRDILQISPPKEPIQKKPKPATEKRPEGISRELYQLIGGAPPVAFVKPTFKSKFQTNKRATPWIHQEFINPARNDGLVLKHWVKQSEADNQGYEFAKFNKTIDILQYTDEDYEKYLTDNDWSKEETDYLFELCKKYDLRFPVIEDRYNYENKQRTMEDLKDRFYSIYRKLILNGKGPTTGDYDRQVLAQQYAFDKSKEIERKNALIMLFNRKKEQVEEEEALLVEAKRIELNESKLAKERESLLNSLQLEQIQQIPSTPNTPLSANHANNFSSPGSIGITGGTASSISSDMKKKRKLQEEMKKGRKLSSATMDVVEPPPEIKREKLTPGVYVRSQKLPIVKPAMQQKMIKTLEELGIGPRPIMPTAIICQKFEHLQNSILNMFELKKLVDKTEMEHKVKLQKGGAGITTNTGRVNAIILFIYTNN